MGRNNKYKQAALDINKQSHANRHINFGVFIYVILLAYLVFMIWHGMTREKIHYIYAEEGIIHSDGEFTGLIIRNEKVIKSEESGDIKYFVPEGRKVRESSYVCAINQDPQLEQIINEKITSHMNQLQDAVKPVDYTLIKTKIKDYILQKNNYDLSYTYSSKELLSTTIQDMSKTVYVEDEELFQQIQNSIEVNSASQLNNGVYVQMENSGVISYTMDGFEGVTVDTFTPELFKQEVHVMNASDKSTIKAKDPLYKIVDNYLFYIVTKVDPKLSKHLESRDYVTLYFPNKNMSLEAYIDDYLYIGEDDYVVFSVDRYFDDFFTDRFVDFKVLYENYAGLKIPNESVTTKQLIKVPKGSATSMEGQLKISKIIEGNDDTTHQTIENIAVKVYYEDEDYSYIGVINEIDTLYVNDKILYRPKDGNIVKMEEFVIDYPTKVEGVYTINYGYADFHRIETIYENESFRIIDQYTKYSVTAYDRVVSDASIVDEFTTINE